MSEYDFRSLSPYDFEILVRDVLQAEKGMFFENFKAGRDGGIDLRHIVSPGNEIVVQAKHYVESGYSLLLSQLKNKEATKVQKLAPQEYILATSVSLSPSQMSELRAIFQPFCHEVTILGKEGINNLISLHPKVEQTHFKLWLSSRAVLERVLHSGTYNSSQFEIENIERKMRLYVQHGGFFKAKETLEKEHSCIISGEPGVGKTTLAEMLVVYYIDNGFTLYRINDNINEAIKVDSPDPSAKIIFYYDDFLGQTSLAEKLGKNEDGALLRLIDALKNRPNRRLILTTREYLLNQAKSLHERLHHANLDIYKFVLDLGQYTRAHKAHILYNHIYFSKLPSQIIELILREKLYLKIVDHDNYNPRIVEWMTRKSIPSDVQPEQYVKEFMNALSNPVLIWQYVFENQISEDAQNVLYCLFSMGGEASYDDLEKAFLSKDVAHTQKSNSGAKKFHACLKETEGSFSSSHRMWIGSSLAVVIKFHNPSIKDFLSNRFLSDTDLIRHILANSVFVEQCESFWQLYQEPQKRKPIDTTMQEIFTTALRKNFNGEIPALPKRDQFIRLNRIMDMTELLPKEEKIRFGHDCLEQFNTLVVRVNDFDVSSVKLLKRIENRLLSHIVLSFGKKLIDSASNIKNFQGVAAFVSSYPDVLTEDQAQEIKEDFERYCEQNILDELTNMDSSGCLSELSKIEEVAEALDADVYSIASDIQSLARQLEDEEDRAADMMEDDQFLYDNNPKETNSDITAMFDTLKD